MSLANPYDQYRQNSIETATPTRMVVMLYDGAIRFLSQALAAMRLHKYDQQSHYINKGQAIIAHLRDTLDFKAGGAVADHLNGVYISMFDTLTEANFHDKTERVEEVISALRELRESWIEVDRQCQAGKAAGTRELIAA